MKQADGAWVAPDATLHRRADGTLAPAASVADLSFSGGGSTAPLVTIGDHARSISLTCPGPLPAPTLDGDTAVYADVLPGVDLRMTATADGYHELLVVKTPAAADHPDLARIEFGLSSSGVQVTPTAGGGMAGVDDNGRQIFAAPPAQMWDSRGTGTSPASVRVTKTTSNGASAVADSSPVTAEDGPAPGAGTATVPIDVGSASVAVEPDPGLLSQTDPAAFPLYIDPDVALNSSIPERTLLRSDGITQYNWDNTDQSGGESGKGDGKCGTWHGYYCGPGYVQKLYFQFTPGALKGKHVVSAKFTVTSPWAFQCENRVTDLVRTNNFLPSTTWSSRPKELDWMGDRSFSAGRGSACDPDSPAAPIEFSDNSAEPDENLTPTVQDFAAGRFSKLTLELRAHDEGDASAWKRFKNNATLSVHYIGVPVPPTEQGIVEGSGAPSCETNKDKPDVIADPTPALAARVHVATGGSDANHQAHLRADFLVQREYSADTWGAFEEPVRPASGDPFLTNNAFQSWPSPGTLSEGVLYRLAVSTWAYEDDQSTHIESSSTVTTDGWCYFRVDTTAPKAPVITFNGPYSPCPNPCNPVDGPGQEGIFTFSGAPGDVNKAYQYKLSTDAEWPDRNILSGSTVTAHIVPPLSGIIQLQVKAEDSLGRWGLKAVTTFNVAPGLPAVGRWHFDDTASGGTSPTAADTATGSGSRHAATLRNAGPGWSIMGRRGDGDRSLWLNDSSDPSQQTGYADTASPVVNTRSSFTVSAWAYLTDASQTRTVLSETGTDLSGFALRYSPSVQQWVFVWSWNTGGTRQSAAVNGTTPVTLKAWTHLAASYNATAHKIILYVNGKPQGAPVTLSTSAVAQVSDGALQFGRANYSNPPSYTDYWRGRVDEVAVWERALEPGEILTEAQTLDASGNPAVENIADWNPDGAAGSSANLADTTTGYGRTLTMNGGARLDGGAIVLDGVNDTATTPGPVLDEAGSFTVSTEVELDSDALLTKPLGYTTQLVGQRNADGSDWGLWYKLTATRNDPANDTTLPVGLWYFGRLGTNGVLNAVVSDAPAVSGTPVRLTGVYNTQALTAGTEQGTVSLYVGFVQNGAALPYSTTPASADFTVGNSVVGGLNHYLPGRITDVRLWAGAIADREQLQDVLGG